MTRSQLEHAIRAACDVAEDTEVYVFGSQAILGQFPDAHEALRQSAEADIAPVHALANVDLIDAMLGMDSSTDSSASTCTVCRSPPPCSRLDGSAASSSCRPPTRAR